MSINNMEMIEDTLHIIKAGYYEKQGRLVHLQHSYEQLSEAHVFLPNDVKDICGRTDFTSYIMLGTRCNYNCVNADSFALAIERYHDLTYTLQECSDKLFDKISKPILVLNMANPVHPGGGVRKGAKAQEEDLCRKSSLLISLESEAAREYYKYNNYHYSSMGSDAIILSPNVEIIKDDKGNLLDTPETVAVITCAAPMITYGLKGMSEQLYRELFRQRIERMLKCAAYWGYKHLILSAWGCGAFGNDAALVSDIFYDVLKKLKFNGMPESVLFNNIDFAVLTSSENNYNYRQFLRNFENFYRDKDKAEIQRVLDRKKTRERHLDVIRGSMIGGAAGDALGYAVEFFNEQTISARYGQNGIQFYEIDAFSGKALISDDTQMSLFTANAILYANTRECLRGIGGSPSAYIKAAYQDWYRTQTMPFSDVQILKHAQNHTIISWLTDVPELYHQRAPGNTCMIALMDIGSNQEVKNDSKGCGGIMRIAPLGLFYDWVDNETLDEEGAKLAAVTHKHPLGYMPAAMLTHIINRVTYFRKDDTLKEIIIEARNAIAEMYHGKPYIEDMLKIVDKAVLLSENTDTDLNNIHILGEGWVAEETLAISVYCALRHHDDFSAGIIAAVNHRGDSDSTGAVTGNILGAWLGYEAIDEKWKKHLEIMDVILEISDDLCHGCQMDEYSRYRDEDWGRKYGSARWKT